MNDLKNKLQKILSDPIARGTVILFVGSFLVNIASYAFNLIVGRMLGPTQYGEYLSLITIVYLLSIPFNTAQTVVVKYVAQFKAAQETSKIGPLLILLTKYVTVLTVLVALSLVLATPLIQPWLKIKDSALIVLTALTFISFTPPSVLIASFIGLEKFIQSNILAGAGIILRIVFSILFIEAGLSVAGVFIAMIVSSVISYSASWEVMYRILSTRKKTQNLVEKSKDFLGRFIKPTSSKMNDLKDDILKFTVPTTIATIGIAAITQFDIVLVKAFFSPYEAGIYSSLAIIGKVIPFFTLPLLTALFPQLVAKVTKKENFLKPFYAVLGIITAASLCLSIGYFLFPELVIKLFFGEKYLSAAPYIGLFGLFQTAYAIMNSYITFFLAIGKNKLASHALIAAIAQVILISFLHNSLTQVILISAGICIVFALYYTLCLLKIAYSIKKNTYA